MSTGRVVYQRLYALVSAKLGRCSFCMGLALSGAVAGWAVLAAVMHFWPQFPFTILLVLWPASFTALWVLHVVTFGGRAVVAERQVASIPGPAMTRRRMVGVFGSGVALAVLASAATPLKAFGIGGCHSCCNPAGPPCPCPHHHCNPLPTSPNPCSKSSGGPGGICNP